MYFNLADRKGAAAAAYHRQDVASQMTKADVASALRAARQLDDPSLTFGTRHRRRRALDAAPGTCGGRQAVRGRPTSASAH